MKLYGSDVIQMSQQSEQASSQFVVPNFDFVVIASRNDQWLSAMEVDSSNRSIMFFEFVQTSSHPIN